MRDFVTLSGRPLPDGTRSVCPGTGATPAGTPHASNPYPTCAVCGKEFGGQGRKHRRYGRNAWVEGLPRHYRQVSHA